MTIAISLKVNDGIVLATDSAATIFAQPIENQPTGVINVYENAEKLFNLFKGKPVGAITWGSGSIGSSSISTLMKDFREIQKINENVTGLDIKEITENLAKFIYVEKYLPTYASWVENSRPRLGFIVAGYSQEDSFAQEWKFEINEGKLVGPELVRKNDETGLSWNGEPEAISRLVLGYSTKFPRVLQDCGIDEETIKKIIKYSNKNIAIPFVIAPMPIKDAIDVAEFLVDTTIKFSKFTPGAPTVGGAIDIAAITKHEGFKWIKRKYYYNSGINP